MSNQLEIPQELKTIPAVIRLMKQLEKEAKNENKKFKTKCNNEHRSPTEPGDNNE